MKQKQSKTIWIDLDNSPHVPFFAPIKEELNKRGYRVIFTARDCFQVFGLADLFNLEYIGIGRHYGKNKILKVLGTLYRSLSLLPLALKIRPALGVSHGSRSQFIASKVLRIPYVVIFDYEHARGLSFFKPTLGVAPEVISSIVQAEKFTMGFRGYSGIKEDVYVSSFKPNPDVVKELNLSENKMVVTIRPPANEAHYHNPEAEKLFAEAVEMIGNIPQSVMVILPRNENTQKKMIISKWPTWYNKKKIIIPEKVVNGLDLIWYSDFVISGGGTMNREAAALGVPVYSIFRGKLGAVDKYLSENGRLVLLKSVDDVRTKIYPIKRKKNKQANFGQLQALKQIADAIEETLIKTS